MLAIIYTVCGLIVGFAAVDKVKRYKEQGNPYKAPYLVPVIYALGWPVVLLATIMILAMGREEDQYNELGPIKSATKRTGKPVYICRRCGKMHERVPYSCDCGNYEKDG